MRYSGQRRGNRVRVVPGAADRMCDMEGIATVTERERAIANWQVRLEHAFANASGVLGRRVQKLTAAEREHGLDMTRRFAGFTVLVKSYQDFALQSLDEVEHGATGHHVMSLAFHVAALRRFRVALNAFYDGYYLDAAGDLRGVFEIALYIGAVLKAHVTFNDLHSVATEEELRNLGTQELQRVRHNRVTQIEARLRKLMFGSNSALLETEQAQIRQFLQVLHMHVHRGESNIAVLVLDAVQHGRFPRVEPQVNPDLASLFCNPAVFLAWAHLRTLAYVAWPIDYSADWRRKFTLLDESFRFYFVGWERPFASAVLRLIDTSFLFDRAQASQQVSIAETTGD